MGIPCNRTQIYKTLRNLDRRFNCLLNRKKATARTQQDLELCSKSAIIELGGWIEVSVDNVLIDYSTKKISDAKEVRRIKDVIIGRVYGFDYERNFRPLLEQILGVEAFYKMICPYDADGRLQKLQAQFAQLRPWRNKAAHTNWNGVPLSFDAPSVTLSRFLTIYPILMSMFDYIQKL